MERVASAVVTIYILAIFVSPARPVLATEFSGMRIAALATGGASALDEYLLLEATADSVDPSTLEVAYRSASGLTTRRLIDLTVLGVSSLPGGSKILIANGVDYVSCSPYRVPIARLAIAQALLESQRVDAALLDDIAGLTRLAAACMGITGDLVDVGAIDDGYFAALAGMQGIDVVLGQVERHGGSVQVAKRRRGTRLRRVHSPSPRP